jgi:transposase
VVRQRTQLINAIRGHLAEYGWVAPRAAHMAMLADLLEDEEMTSTLPEAAQPMSKLMVDLLAELDKRITVLDREIARRAKEDEAARRLMTIPGIGSIAATAIIALAPQRKSNWLLRHRGDNGKVGYAFRISCSRCRSGPVQRSRLQINPD